MTDYLGCHLIARKLREVGVECIFGVVGIPVVEFARACQVCLNVAISRYYYVEST